MAGITRRVSYRELLKKCNILPVAMEFLLSLLLLYIMNMEKCKNISGM
jgi:hypothetical protein